MNRKNSFNDMNRIEVSVTEDEIGDFQKRERKRNRKIPLPIIFLLVWIGLYFISLIFGVRIYLPGTGGEGYNRASYFMQYITLFIEESYNLFFHAGSTGNIEMYYCQFLGVALAGAALAACGAAFQGVFKNVLAGPSTMGVMSGGSMGCMIYLLVFYGSSTVSLGILPRLSGLLQPIFTLAGCFGGVLLILAVSLIAGRGKVSSDTMVIAGTVFSGVISNIMLVIQYWIIANDPSDDRIEMLRLMMMGNFNQLTSLTAVTIMAIPILVCLFILLFCSVKMNLLSFGEEDAQAMGLNVRRYKNLMILTGTVLTAMVVAFCGRIGFIGFLVPLVVRRMTGPDLRKLLPAAMTFGALLMTLIFDLACMVGLQDYMSVITGPLGCAVMIFTLFRKGGGRDEAGKGAAAPGMGFR
ncbi:MAG: iron chelate uptake ABC transporter family permease subunit [Clostridiales bacterium]|nr:iron chelate uptake ABC transporter family permease subunit [Clostridiales bacterium]